MDTPTSAPVREIYPVKFFSGVESPLVTDNAKDLRPQVTRNPDGSAQGNPANAGLVEKLEPREIQPVQLQEPAQADEPETATPLDLATPTGKGVPARTTAPD
jgi:hypothetical protein